MKKFAFALATIVVFAAPAAINAKAPQCRGSNGQFIKCPTPAPTASASATAHPAAPAAQRCRKNGQFAKCGTPGAVPVAH